MKAQIGFAFAILASSLLAPAFLHADCPDGSRTLSVTEQQAYVALQTSIKAGASSACRMGTQRSRGEDDTGSTIQYVQGSGRCSWLLRYLFFRRTGKEECRSQPRARHARARSFEVHAGRTKSVG